MSLSHRTWSIRTHFVHSRAGLPRPVFETIDNPANPHPHDPPSRNPSLPRELSNRLQRLRFMAINQRRRICNLRFSQTSRCRRHWDRRDNFWRHLQQRHFVRTTTLLPQEWWIISSRPKPVIQPQRQPLQLLYLRSRSHRHRRQRPQQDNFHRKQPTPPKRPTHPVPDRNLPLDRIIPDQTETIQLHRTQQSSGDTKHSNMDLRRSPPNSHTWLLPNGQLDIRTTRNMVI